MADINKCTGEGCTQKEKCYRFTAISSEFQMYFEKPPIKDGKCDMYWLARVHHEHIAGSNYKVIKNK